MLLDFFETFFCELNLYKISTREQVNNKSQLYFVTKKEEL